MKAKDVTEQVSHIADAIAAARQSRRNRKRLRRLARSPAVRTAAVALPAIVGGALIAMVRRKRHLA